METLPLHRKQNLCSLVKYVAALLVVNGHLFIFGNPGSVVTPYMNLGACCVALFYFFSGYGLVYSYLTKGDKYLKGFFSKRFTKILIPLITAYAVCLPIYALLKGPVQLSTLISTLYWGGPYLKFTWFVTEILIVYILFYINMRISGLRTTIKLTILSGCIVLLMTCILIFNQPIWYAVSLPGFIFGIWYCKYENRIISLTHRNVLMLLVSVGMIWFMTWQWHHTLGGILTQYRYEFLSLFVAPSTFSIFVIFLIVNNINTPPLDLVITHSSYEVYLIQSAAMTLAQSFTNNFTGYWLATMTIVIVMGVLVHRVNKFILNNVVNSGRCCPSASN